MTVKHSIIGYLLGEGFRNVFHNKKSSGASLAIMCATMLIFGLFFMIIENPFLKPWLILIQRQIPMFGCLFSQRITRFCIIRID